MGLPLDLEFRTKGQLAIDISTDAAAGGIRPDFYYGDEVYGSCAELRGHFEAEGQAYVLRVPSNFMITLAAGTKMTCAEAVKALLKHKRRWEIRSAGHGVQGRALVCLGVARHRLPAPSSAHPPPPQDRGTGLPLLLRARRAGADQDPADPRSWAEMAGGRKISSSARTASDLASARRGSTPRSSATSCSSWLRWRSALSPPRCCATAPTPRRRPQSGPTSRRRRNPG